ncbi:MAG: 16S rRNA (cytosine(1402)-N(4))-methyltransferase RsmH [Deltaproteobacteria bacterium]|nr:16S rRNA (cytosine(1402)-N(4))-methyltransferase RsmH [Deltaproteobacteria bacterium]
MHSIKSFSHVPVLLNEVIEMLGIIKDKTFLDATFGEGGHTGELLKRGAKGVLALDRDFEAIQEYKERGPFRGDNRLALIHGRFSKIDELTPQGFDGIVVDLGASTKQLLSPTRGFSFQHSAALDMRMDQTAPQKLEDLLLQIEPEELATALRNYAEIPGAHKLARRIVEGVRAGQLCTTGDLASLVKMPGKRHPATRLFMALRMLINEEMLEIETGLPKLVRHLKPEGRLVVLTFHSVEDRTTKRTLKQLSGACTCDHHPCLCLRLPLVRWITKHPITPSKDELDNNPRSRSAKLRCVEKIVESGIASTPLC